MAAYYDVRKTERKMLNLAAAAAGVLPDATGMMPDVCSQYPLLSRESVLKESDRKMLCNAVQIHNPTRCLTRGALKGE